MAARVPAVHLDAGARSAQSRGESQRGGSLLYLKCQSSSRGIDALVHQLQVVETIVGGGRRECRADLDGMNIADCGDGNAHGSYIRLCKRGEPLEHQANRPALPVSPSDVSSEEARPQI